jgi:hypothetical protein
VRRPADEAIVSYLRHYFMHGWVFREVMKNRPTVCIPDDHDVFQGNIWGEGGEAMTKPIQTSTKGGYAEPVRTVNAIYRTQTGHHPGVQNLKPAKRGMRVMYGDMVYGNLSIAILADRQFKSSPRKVDTGEGRADIVHDPDFDASSIDKPGLNLLGQRQLDFLRDWVADWRGATMKVLLSQTTFSNPMTHTGPEKERVYLDLDSNAWPQSKRDQALRVLRRGFTFHLAGDQHLPSLVQHGIDQQHDSIWTFAGPAISTGWPRWFDAASVGIFPEQVPAHGLPNTGAFRDGFGNLMYVQAIGNPPAHDYPANAPKRYKRSHRKVSGFGMATFDKFERTIRVDAYKFFAGLGDGEARQFPGWPVTVSQQSSYARSKAGYLRKVTHDGAGLPVVKVYDQQNDRLVYALRLKQNSFEPFVFEEGTYRVKIGNPDTGNWQQYDDLTIERPAP